MAGAAPQTKISEVFALFEYEGYKDLDSFAVKSKLARLRRDMNALLSKEAYQGYTGLGIIASYECDDDLAVKMFKKALNRSPNNFQAISNYGFALRHAGRVDEFSAHFLAFLEKNPTSKEVFFLLVDHSIRYARSDEYQKTLKIFQGKLTDHEEMVLQVKSESMSSLYSVLDDSGIAQVCYEQQIIRSNAAIRSIFSFGTVDIEMSQDFEGGYLSTRFSIKNAKAEHLSLLTDAYLDSMFDWAQQEQASEGTDVCELMMNSVVSFTSHAEQHSTSTLEVI